MRRAIFAVLLLLLAGPAILARAEAAAPGPFARQVDVYFFWRTGCPHCEREQAFLARLQAEHPALRLHAFNVWEEPASRRLIQRVGAVLGADASAVPLTVVGGQAFSGYLSDATTGREIELRVLECMARDCTDPVAPLLRADADQAGAGQGVRPPQPARLPAVELPLFGAVATEQLSLPALTVLLAALDGFNPCAMWTLLMLLGLLIGVPDRRRRWVLGGTFIAASALVYFLFLTAWLNLFLFLGMVLWVRVAVGGLAVAGGIHYLRQFALRRDAVCEVTRAPERRRVLERLRALVLRQGYAWALAGIVSLAFAVNLIELLCSAGIPAVYTRVLTLSALPAWQYYAYLLLYIGVFMLDDLLVFFVTLKALEVAGLGTRYARASHLLGGLVLLGIGALLLLRPQWLVFG
jgi:thiol-disulfide isomerase/thioredoxin